MNSFLGFIFVLGVLVFVHELGHFLAARRLGVRVITFSLGFGPKILKFTRGDTEYCVSIIPLGGYVKMAGENPRNSRGCRRRVHVEDKMGALSGSFRWTGDEFDFFATGHVGRALSGCQRASV